MSGTAVKTRTKDNCGGPSRYCPGRPGIEADRSIDIDGKARRSEKKTSMVQDRHSGREYNLDVQSWQGRPQKAVDDPAWMFCASENICERYARPRKKPRTGGGV
jgi:hypothetical protein